MITFDKRDRAMDIECNNCGDTSTFYGDFATCITEARQEGWKMVKTNFEWKHKCPFCVEKESNPKEVFGDS